MTWIAVPLSLATVWGHFACEGRGVPGRPHELVATTTWSAFGRWPYFVTDAAGDRIEWDGAVIALIATVAIVALARTVLRANGAVGVSATSR